LNIKNMSEQELRDYGRKLDEQSESLQGQTWLMNLAENLLFVRTRSGVLNPLRANLVQQVVAGKEILTDAVVAALNGT